MMSVESFKVPDRRHSITSRPLLFALKWLHVKSKVWGGTLWIIMCVSAYLSICASSLKIHHAPKPRSKKTHEYPNLHGHTTCCIAPVTNKGQVSVACEQ